MAVMNSFQILNTTLANYFPSFLDSFAPFVRILQFLGIVFTLWLLFSILQLFMKFRDSRRLKRIEEKLDILLIKSSRKK